jgi:Putative polyhydroxyalkanoic acid system protein (PHA_gran_rgn)
MPSPVVVTIEHRSDKETVKRKLQGSLDQIRAQLASLVTAIDQHWNGDVLEFHMSSLGQAISGKIEVGEAIVRVELLLPGLLGVFARTISSRIREQGQKLLEKK